MDNKNQSQEISAIQTYEGFERPFCEIVLLSIILIAIASSIVLILVPLDRIVISFGSFDRIVLGFYFCTYIATWVVYFRSKKKDIASKDKPIQSLRRLLGEACVNWDYNPCHTESESVKEAFRRKASTTMEVIAILIAVSILILDITSNLLNSNMELDTWQQYSLWISSLLAVFSFICFVISVDSLDTLFNRFSSTPDRNVIVHYFYHITINPKYFGMVSMITSVILILQVYSAMLASIAISLMLMIGYPLWFPNIKSTMEQFGIPSLEKNKKCTPFPAYIDSVLLTIFLVLPVVIHLIV